jgi:hypothetical protein
VVLEETGVFRREDGPEEGRRDLPEADGAPVDRVALPLGAQPLPPGADERGRRRVAPPEEDDLRKRDEDDENEDEEKKKRKISQKVRGTTEIS